MITLSVASVGSPNARFYQDIGSFGFSGSVSDPGDSTTVEVYRYGADRRWHRLRRATIDTDGRWSASYPVTDTGEQRFVATLGGNPSDDGARRSAVSSVTVLDAKVIIDEPDDQIDALRSPTLTGRVVPVRAGVLIHLQARSTGDYYDKATVRTDADGRFAVKFRTGVAEIKSYRIRTRYRSENSERFETSSSFPIARVKALHAVITPTTAAEVAKTYRAGCPVGPSQLSTVTMNYWGFDRRMHRGVLIVRSTLTTRVTRAFKAALDGGYVIRKMNNPNVYGGHDPTQMAADNTSGFNCRKVVGNPYAQSPHSYGIAIDINTVENPYRDVTGKWWPKNGKPYIDRSHWRTGMLTASSSMTRALQKQGYFWGGRWSPGRDYQHSEKR